MGLCTVLVGIGWRTEYSIGVEALSRGYGKQRVAFHSSQASFPNATRRRVFGIKKQAVHCSLKVSVNKNHDLACVRPGMLYQFFFSHQDSLLADGLSGSVVITKARLVLQDIKWFR